MGRKFRKHKLAIAGLPILALFYFGALFCEFFSTQDIYTYRKEYVHCPPMRIRFMDHLGRFHLRPFVYGLKKTRDPVILENVYEADMEKTQGGMYLMSIPTIPLWMALSAALPAQWPTLRVYFGITIILSIVGWCGLARVVRGKLLELREEDFVMAAKISGAGKLKIITGHLLPSFLRYLIVNLTLAILRMILGETTLSFLGLGLRAPAVSWGTLLQDARSVRTLSMHPWLLIPALFVIATVLAFNFLGDGLRDAADPYK